MRARDLMQTDVITVRETDSTADVCDRLQEAHVHGAPVVSEDGVLVGFVSQEDVLFGSMGTSAADGSPTGGDENPVTAVREIMTAPAVSATEETPLERVCQIMWRFRLHHIPIIRTGKVIGIVSSLDLCRAIAEGEIVV